MSKISDLQPITGAESYNEALADLKKLSLNIRPFLDGKVELDKPIWIHLKTGEPKHIPSEETRGAKLIKAFYEELKTNANGEDYFFCVNEKSLSSEKCIAMFGSEAFSNSDLTDFICRKFANAVKQYPPIILTFSRYSQADIADQLKQARSPGPQQFLDEAQMHEYDVNVPKPKVGLADLLGRKPQPPASSGPGEMTH